MREGGEGGRQAGGRGGGEVEAERSGVLEELKPKAKRGGTAMRGYGGKAKVSDARKVRAAQLPSNKGFFIFIACCATGAVAMIAFLVAGEIKGARVAPDIEHKAKIFD